MYPRLQLLRQFLSEDGAIFVSIDDNEVQNLRALMDQVFGKRNFIDTIIWQKNFSPKNSARHFSADHDYIVVYARNSERWTPNRVTRGEAQDARYKNPDKDSRGPWTSGDLSARNYYSLGTYALTCPSGRVIPGPPKGTYWRVSSEKFAELDKDRRIWWGKNGDNVPRLKRFLTDVRDGMVPQTLWLHQEVGNTQEAKKELVSIVEFEHSDDVFITPKPVRLMRRILEIGAHRDSLVLDSFAGSGTLGHAVLEANRDDGGTRRFIMVEMDEKIAGTVTVQRMRKVVDGYQPLTGGDIVPGLGGGYRFCTLGETLFDDIGAIRQEVAYGELARHVHFAETGLPLPRDRSGNSPLLGVHDGEAIYLLYNGVLGDRRPDAGNILTAAVLADLPPHDGPKIIYGEGCRIGAARLARERITFKQTPYDVRVS